MPTPPVLVAAPAKGTPVQTAFQLLVEQIGVLQRQAQIAALLEGDQRMHLAAEWLSNGHAIFRAM